MLGGQPARDVALPHVRCRLGGVATSRQAGCKRADERNAAAAALAQSLCQNFATLQSKGHPKWREVQIALPDLGRRWQYYAATSRELRACRPAPAPQLVRKRECTQSERILGLCA